MRGRDIVSISVCRYIYESAVIIQKFTTAINSLPRKVIGNKTRRKTTTYIFISKFLIFYASNNLAEICTCEREIRILTEQSFISLILISHPKHFLRMVMCYLTSYLTNFNLPSIFAFFHSELNFIQILKIIRLFWPLFKINIRSL